MTSNSGKTIKASAEFRIVGFVQGVGFRYFVMRHAVSLGLTGYVSNSYEGSVTVYAEGEKVKIEELARLLRQGPSRSAVDKVECVYSEYYAKYSSFGIK